MVKIGQTAEMTGLQKKGGNKRSREASGRLAAILAGGILVKGRLVMHSLEMCCKCDQWNFQQKTSLTHDIWIFT